MKLDIVVLWITFTIDRLNEMRKMRKLTETVIVNYPITKIEGSYVWVEERDDVGGMFPNSRIINYFDKSKNMGF